MRVYSSRRLAWMLVLACFAGPARAQTVPDRWDDIHFENGSSTLVEGLAELSRLAALLKSQPDYQVRLTGYGDPNTGSSAYESLSLARAKAVGDYLAKNGAAPEQTILEAGKRVVLAANASGEDRFRARRVSITLLKAVTAASAAADLFPFADMMKKLEEGQVQALKRLDKLDDLEKENQELRGALDKQQGELKDLQNHENMLRDQIASLPKPLTRAQTEEIVQGAIAPPNRWSGGLPVRDFLIGSDAEVKKYGLYSYLLIPRQPGKTEDGLKQRYLAAIDAYLTKIDTVEAMNRQNAPPPPGSLNITYFPLQFRPVQTDTESILGANNSALAKKLVHLVQYWHHEIDGREGPFIVSYNEPLTGLQSIGRKHLFFDLSNVPPDVVKLYVRGFIAQSGRENFWEKNRGQWILDCYAFIESGGGALGEAASTYTKKTFLASIFRWSQ